MKTLKFLLVSLWGLVSYVSSFAYDFYDFKVDGIPYSIVSADEQTVEVARDYYGSPFSGDVVIPESIMYNGKEYKVVGIGESAFYGCDSLTSVSIPEDVTYIDFGAFNECRSLTSVKLPEALKSIGDYAFADCSSLTSIVFPKSLTSIEDCAFWCCSSLTSVTIPENVSLVGVGAFGYCSNLVSIDVDKNNSALSSYDGVLYDKNQGLLIACPGKLKGDFIIPKRVSLIMNFAFAGCSSLTSITIPENVSYIQGLPFDGCSSLTSINVDRMNDVYSSHEGVLYDISMTKLLRCPGGMKGDFIISPRITYIEGHAFEGCRELKSVLIPESVTDTGAGVFSGCSSLTTITIPESLTYIASETFLNCSGLTSVSIPGSVTDIGECAFEGCSSLTSVTIPEGVRTIKLRAFKDCTSLTYLSIPESVTSIAWWAFAECSNLANIYLKWKSPIEADMDAFECSEKNLYETATLYIPEGTLSEYQAVTPWSFFRNIQSGSSIDSVKDNGSLYYSASDETLYIGCENTSVRVFDVNGRIVFDVQGTPTVSVSELVNGTYVAVSDDGRSVKFVK